VLDALIFSEKQLLFGEQFAQIQMAFKEAFSIPIHNGAKSS
jgi:hypothetical protein